MSGVTRPVEDPATELAWPAAPYKGLNYYSPSDHPLFAGRDDDIALCAQSLGDHGTRLMLLHGLTGCGKSSFLRAGLIPYLEGDAGGFQFLRDADPGGGRALFVRSTHAPLQQLAKAIYEFASRGVELRTPRGPRQVDLTPARLGNADLESFCDDISRDAERMQAPLTLIGDRLPRTLVLVIDQGEEVLTLRPGKQGDRHRGGFFQFLVALSRADLDLRVVVALRTEYYGRFRHELQIRAADPARVRDFYLATLDHDSLMSAIERPTLETPVGSFSAPRMHYRFSYEPGLSEQIATDLEAASPAGGILPAMQIVCERLYEKTRRNTTWQITSADYEQLGGADGQIHAHLNDALRLAIQRTAPRLGNMRLRRERARWKQALSQLVNAQVDGSVTTQLRLEQEMVDAAKRAGCKQRFAPMMEALCTDELRVCRRVELMRRDLAIDHAPPQEHDQPTICYCLGHDAIGLALNQWNDARKLVDRGTQKLFSLLTIPLMLGGIYCAFQIEHPLRVFDFDGPPLDYRNVWPALLGVVISLPFLWLIFRWYALVIRFSPSTLARIWRIIDKKATTQRIKALQQRARRALDIHGSD